MTPPEAITCASCLRDPDKICDRCVAIKRSRYEAVMVVSRPPRAGQEDPMTMTGEFDDA